MNLPQSRVNTALFFTCAILYMELVLRLFTGGEFFNIGLIFISVFSVVAGFVIHAVCSLMEQKAARITSGVITTVLGVLYATQTIYYSVFNNFVIVYSLKAGGTNQIIEDGIIKNTVEAIVNGLPVIILLSIPSVIIFTPLVKVLNFKKLKRTKSVIWLGIALGLHIAATVVISFVPSLAIIQSGLFDANTSMNRFGLLRTEQLDIHYNLLGVEQELELEQEEQEEEIPAIKPEEPKVYTPNVMDIDFEGLKENETDKTFKLMNEYFSSKEPTYKNEYTGMYKGYNLISVVAEGFSPYAIHPELTPTLYKMQQQGFEFTNFYTPIWGVSTSDGEYTACTGLVPKSGVWSFYRSSKNYMPFCLGNVFRSNGITNTYAYHNNTAGYYHRDKSHPNMGYVYKGIGTGVEKYVKNVWPQSDLEMVSGSVKDYISADKPFHAYYMTVSGHLNYTRIGNSMAAKNWSLVKDLDCSETLKAYYACNIELDRAMEKLLAELNAAGVADKTVITITPDHYPYGLEKDEGDKYEIWTELLGRKVETNFELYKSCFLLYCQSTENAPKVDKYCYSADILPTILNLFGFEYDSRLLMGKDIMSDSEALVMFNNRSFITEHGKYNSSTKEFIPFDENAFKTEEEKDEYVEMVKATVNNQFKMSAKILEEDYYRYIFKK